MAQEKDKQRYVPPEITRVVLRSEQAVLSACSTTGPTTAAMGGLVCVDSGCRKAPSSGGAPSGSVSS